MSKLLFKTKTREEAQRRLTKLIADGGNDRAEIRETKAGAEPFEVWDGPVDASAPVSIPAATPTQG